MASRQPPSHDPQYLDEHHQRISEFAAEYFEDDEEREAFVDTLLERRGYQRTTGCPYRPSPPRRAAAAVSRERGHRRRRAVPPTSAADLSCFPYGNHQGSET